MSPSWETMVRYEDPGGYEWIVVALVGGQVVGTPARGFASDKAEAVEAAQLARMKLSAGQLPLSDSPLGYKWERC